MQKKATTFWMALAVPFLNHAGGLAPIPPSNPAPAVSVQSAGPRTGGTHPQSEIPLLIRILLTPPPDLRATWPNLEEDRQMEALFSVQQ